MESCKIGLESVDTILGRTVGKQIEGSKQAQERKKHNNRNDGVKQQKRVIGILPRRAILPPAKNSQSRGTDVAEDGYEEYWRKIY
ncbi:hypothetical protein N7495_002910 [Penicillium taxi]|uniref:uncharacterized protein n=1 Tax=Penicillium taxi TaxID=168475 RepID=UPI0025458D7F|nr:uncharacterized protein N7495_002910 [Penicillium taxi]KAJ5902382.1 hypothetical protein N7495_002910 [Penicillium taxi]